MPGFANSDNKFGPTPYLVDPIVGNGATYSTIQSAIDAAFAAGGGTVMVRDGTYTENLTFKAEVDVLAVGIEGRVPPPNTQVVVQGHHTFAPVGAGIQECLVQGIGFVDPAFGDLFTISPTAGTFALFGIKYCNATSTNGAGAGRCFVLNPDGTSEIVASIFASNSNSGSHCVECTGAGNYLVQFFEGGASTSETADAVRISAGAAQVSCQYSTLQGSTFGIEDMTGTCNIAANDSVIAANSAAVSFTVPGGQMTSYHNTLTSSGPNVIAGTGTFSHADSIFTGTTTLAGTITEQKVNWQPYASAGTSGTAFRGTAGFDDAQFTLTNGFVQGIGGAFQMPWLDISTDTTAAANTAYFCFDGGPIVLTLPIAPPQGTQVCFAGGDGITTPIIQAPAGVRIRIGQANTSVGGVATGTTEFSSICLVYRAALGDWMAPVGPQGNWGLT